MNRWLSNQTLQNHCSKKEWNKFSPQFFIFTCHTYGFFLGGGGSYTIYLFSILNAVLFSILNVIWIFVIVWCYYTVGHKDLFLYMPASCSKMNMLLCNQVDSPIYVPHNFPHPQLHIRQSWWMDVQDCPLQFGCTDPGSSHLVSLYPGAWHTSNRKY